ncbi:MAG TPA: ADOP family duplicated permease [Acidobacteriota bacterium]|nr:ADOP family duplicated permease [Acidobacteriota bacterium]
MTRLLLHLHGWLLRSFPAPFRLRHREHIQSLVEESLHQARREHGCWRALSVWLSITFDTLVVRLSSFTQAGGEPEPSPPPLRPPRRAKDLNLMEGLIQDIRFGLRSLRSHPVFAMTAILTLAIGIGANAATFNLVDVLLWRPGHLENPDQLAGLYLRRSDQPNSYRGFSYPNFQDLRELTGNVFEELAAQEIAMVGIEDGDMARRRLASIVTANYFSALGVSPVLGRPFNAEEERPGSQIASAVISYGLYTRLGGDPALLGSQLGINGRDFSVVGVTPPGFSGITAIWSPDVWLPLGTYEMVVNDFMNRAGARLSERGNHALMVFGRLRKGLRPEDAENMLRPAVARLAEAHPKVNEKVELMVGPVGRLTMGTAPPSDDALNGAATAFMLMAAMVLLVACLNISSLQRGRWTHRRGEFAIRLALGGGRMRLVRQVLTECLLLAVAGGAAGLAFAFWIPWLMSSVLSSRIPLVQVVIDASPDWRVVAAALAFSLLSIPLFGLRLAWRLSHQDLRQSLPGQGQASRRQRGGWLRSNLPVLAQVALSLVLLVAAGLFLASARNAADPESLLDLDSSLVMEIDPSLAGLSTEESRGIYADLERRLATLPGVEAVSRAGYIPYGMAVSGRSVAPASEVGADGTMPDDAVGAGFNMIGGQYFQVLGVGLLRGRPFGAAEADSAESAPVTIIDTALAERLWPGEDPMGRFLRVAGIDRDLEVVGVVPTLRDRHFGAVERPHVYVPASQVFQSNQHIHVRSAAGVRTDWASLSEQVRREVRLAAPQVPVLSLRTLREHVESSLGLWVFRAGAVCFSVLGGLALFLALVGVYGVRAYQVARRRKEIGIRMALGAARGNITWMVLRDGLLLAAAGCGAGLLLALGVSQGLQSMLFQVSATEPSGFLLAPMLLTAAVLLACYLPARRAAKVNATSILRME